MLPKALDDLVRDIESGSEASLRLKKTINRTEKGITRAHKLELITRVLDHVCNSRSELVENAFRVALESLRTFVPFLKKNTNSLTDTIAAVEKYAVNFALSSPSQDVKQSTGREAQLSTSLRLILSSRAKAQSETNGSKRVTRNKSIKRRHDKENEDPDEKKGNRNTVFLEDDIIDRLFFSQAAKLGVQSLLPNRDSIDVARTTAGALAIRLTKCCNDMCLRDLLSLTEHAVLPWLRYVRDFDDENSQRGSSAHLARVSCFLFDQCRKPQTDPETILQTRLCALQLEDRKLSQFSRDLLQSVNNFSRSKMHEKYGRHDLDVISSVYEEALRYVAKFDSSDRRWVSEDVSAWLDNVALVWSKQKLRKPLPNVFALRISTFQQQPTMKTLLECFKLQLELFNVGAYELEADTVPRTETKLFHAALWEDVGSLLRNISVKDLLDSDEREKLFALSTNSQDDWRVAETDGLRCLRLLRTLEPIRRAIAAKSTKSRLPHGAELVLRTYLSALLRGFLALSCPVKDVDSLGSSAVGDVLLRLNKMVGGGIEAARDLIRSYSHQHLFDGVEDAISVASDILKYHETFSPRASLSWREWLYRVITSTSKEALRDLNRNKCEQEGLVLLLSEAMLYCADHMLHFDSGVISFSPGYSTVLIAVREGLLSHQMWAEAADMSLRLFEHITTSSGSEGRSHIMASETARMVAQDVIRLSRNGNTLTFFADLNIPTDKLLSIFLEYAWWSRQNRDSFKSPSKYLETIDRLVLIRRAVFQYCDTNDLHCPVRSAHAQWLAFLYSWSDGERRATKKAWKAVKAGTCSGHHTLGLADPDVCEVSCASFHFQFLENLRNACQQVILKSFHCVTDCLSAMESIFTTNEQLGEHLELMTVSVEVLQFIGIDLAFNSFGKTADRTFRLALKCGSRFNIPLFLCETRKLCSLLDNLPRLSPGHIVHGEGAIAKPLEEIEDASSVFRVLHQAESDLKNTLRALRKSKTDSEEEPYQLCTVAGFQVAIGFTICSVAGQHRLGLVLELILCLFHLGTVHLNVENLYEARYYMEHCFQVSLACFPAENNSFRRIASISKAKCMTRKHSRASVQDSIMEHVVLNEEDIEDGRDSFSNFTTLQTMADAMLYVEMAWQSNSQVLSDCDGSYVDSILTLQERCRGIVNTLTSYTKPFPNFETNVACLQLNLGLTYLLKDDEITACKLIEPLTQKGNFHKPSFTAAALYHVARLYLSRARGLQTCLTQCPTPSGSQNEGQSRRITRSRSRRSNLDKPHTFLDNARMALRRAVQDLVPCVGNFQLCRRVWNLAAMVDSDPEAMALMLEKTVGLSFNARYGNNVKRKALNRTKNVRTGNHPSDIQDLEEHLQRINLDDSNAFDRQHDQTEVMTILAHSNCVLAGLHMDEDKTSIVLWRRCALGFHLRRLWLPSAGSQSYDGIMQRIESILTEMKMSSISEGQELTKDEKVAWWEERYRLDNEMKLVLTEIQEIWLGEAINMLIPSVAAICEEGVRQNPKRDLKTYVRDFTTYVKLGERACDASDHGAALGHLVLLTDKASERIPWESLPLLRENVVSATRTPSMLFLAKMWNPNRCIDYRSLFYVLNPYGNLQRTEDRFRDELQSHPAWSGIIGQTSAKMVISSYEEEQIYLYCGHGAGEEFFTPSKVCTHAMAPVALLMGCSSCRPRDIEIGDFESNGPAIEFLVSGSPAVVGNLWDVSDGEIDRLTASVLSLWLGTDDDERTAETVSLADAVAQSRSKCRLPYLVGAACIVMGVPHIRVQQTSED